MANSFVLAPNMAGSPIRSADHRLDLDLSRFTKGEHLLSIEAKRGARTAMRDLRFTVR